MHSLGFHQVRKRSCHCFHERLHLVQGLGLLQRTSVRQQAAGAMIAKPAGEGFCHDGPLAVGELGWLFS